ncbi:MAG: TAT-variant-translocated molybdopterin oxidoreductase [Planctomycetes bacterium]|nr:TAT-variant-translocated molybdopterin oxidoreductase [Planctomycetota bacterium]
MTRMQSEAKRFWRSLEELANDEGFRDSLDREFPDAALEAPNAATRRQFLTLMGASLAMAGVTGCRQPREEIVPYIETPEQIAAGNPLYFATAMTLGGVATGLLVEQHMGRPTKIEGNPDHPASLGATDAFAQAAVLTLYDPDRSTEVIHHGQRSTWPRAAAALRAAMEELRSREGEGLRVLTDTITSPTLAWELETLLEAFPQARWHQYEPVARGWAREGARLAFGEKLDVVYNLENADTILSLDADLFDCGPGSIRYAREFADRRRVWRAAPQSASMNRLYAVGPTPSPSSAVADHRLPLRAGDVAVFARALAEELEVPAGPPPSPTVDQVPAEWLSALAGDLRRHRGRSLIVAGDFQPPAVHALAHALNAALGNVGETIAYIPPVHARPVNEMESLRELADDMEAGEVEAVVVLGANAVFSAPADVEFARAMQRVPFRLHLGLYHDETARLCHWHVPETHFLETWGDARAYNGAASLIQPLIAPLYGGVSPLELVATLHGGAERSAYDLLREFWREQWSDRDEGFERLWKQALHEGVIEGTAFAPAAVELQESWWGDISDSPEEEESSELEVVFRPDPTIYDGRFANNAWLQELPKPLTKITWENVAVFAPATAEKLGLTVKIGGDGGEFLTDLVELTYRGRTIEAPAWIQPGHAADSVTVYFGYGRTHAGRVGDGVGFDAYRLRTSYRPWFDDGLMVRKTGRRYHLAATQLHHTMHGRDIVHAGTLEEYHSDPHSITHPQPKKKQKKKKEEPKSLPVLESPPASLAPEHQYKRYKWGMVIDQTVCTGCSACVVACQAENNIPVVGKEEVARGREMHWLRIDAYYEGDDPKLPDGVYFQPVPCMHCEKAPCELVCPVNATVHSDEGLNDMNYARCVGTRYCSNNCPYKVRRFNYFQYADWVTESLKPLRNPDVTVRSRGVMEKCTYCVQRINAARIHAEKDDRPLVKNREGEWIKPIYENELLTACQAACPTQAIAFGDLNDPDSEVSKMRYKQPLQYGLMAEHLGTQPRTTYLAALRNPNPEITAH